MRKSDFSFQVCIYRDSGLGIQIHLLLPNHIKSWKALWWLLSFFWEGLKTPLKFHWHEFSLFFFSVFPRISVNWLTSAKWNHDCPWWKGLLGPEILLIMKSQLNKGSWGSKFFMSLSFIRFSISKNMAC